MEDEAKKHGYSVLFGSSDENLENSQRLIDTFINRQIDGFIIAPAEGTASQLEYLKKPIFLSYSLTVILRVWKPVMWLSIILMQLIRLPSCC
ncbi:hypothetical protein [Sphingobacterium sp. E70]|uniref:hypothetical protein n=1 Tax=Sphingobacterium sp. E70 TaxID=2853439 RepID=UPI00359C1C64